MLPLLCLLCFIQIFGRFSQNQTQEKSIHTHLAVAFSVKFASVVA